MGRKGAIDAVFAALAEPARRGVVDLLRKGPRRASELADALDLSRSAMSRHLRQLWRSGLVEEQRFEDDARVRLFRLRREPFDALASWLADVETYWTRQLAAFKEHAEKSRGRKPPS